MIKEITTHFLPTFMPEEPFLYIIVFSGSIGNEMI